MGAQSHFKNQCDKIARAQRQAQQKAQSEAPKKTQAELDLEQACHGARGVAALAKSCPAKKDEIASTRAPSTNAPQWLTLKKCTKPSSWRRANLSSWRCACLRSRRLNFARSSELSMRFKWP